MIWVCPKENLWQVQLQTSDDIIISQLNPPFCESLGDTFLCARPSNRSLKMRTSGKTKFAVLFNSCLSSIDPSQLHHVKESPYVQTTNSNDIASMTKPLLVSLSYYRQQIYGGSNSPYSLGELEFTTFPFSIGKLQGSKIRRSSMGAFCRVVNLGPQNPLQFVGKIILST